MSKLAIYEKHDATRDLHKRNYFRHDYVYKKNVSLRFFTLIGGVIVVVFYLIHQFAMDNADLFTMDWTAEAKRVIFIMVGILLLYSLIGTIKYNIEYEASMKRLKRYNALISLLDKEDSREE